MFEQKTISTIVEEFGTDKERGLSSEEASRRLSLYGLNKLEEKKKKSWIRIFFEQMNNPMIFVLFAAIAVTIGVSIYETIKVANNGWILTSGEAVTNAFLEVGDWPDVLIVLLVILLNSLIGTIQEVKAQTSLDALKSMSAPECNVIRDGKRLRIKSQELVVGDLIVLEEGDTIGADIRLIESVNLKVNESSLTGESVPVMKNADITLSSEVALGDRLNLAYMSTPVTYGRGRGIVVSTGMNTEIGHIASALDEEENEETPLQKVLAKLSKVLGLLTLVIVFLVLAVDIIYIFVHNQNNDINAWIDSVLSAIALAVAAIPEGLAAVVTIVLSIGVQRMVKANTVVRKLPSVETLGAVSVVCSDKTGTLTENKMTVVEAYVDNTYFADEHFNESHKEDYPGLTFLAKGMSLCSNASVDDGYYGDPTEICLVVLANKFNMHKKDIEKETPRVDELPFDSVRKMMSTKHKENDKYIIYTKGALDSILLHANKILINGEVRSLTEEDKNNIYKANKHFSDKALRVLALAYKYSNEKISEDNLIFVGLVAMIDPARKEAKPAVATFKSAGITTIMITGDHIDTAFAIAKQLGIADDISECVMGKDIDNLSFEELCEKVKTTRVFARVSPQNKVSIVKAFKENGNIVAMTGDGVNDAPSLKAADIGIAMGITGTDVAKGSADMVLVDDNFASIEKAVEEGRGIFANIKKTVLFLLSSNIAEVLAMFVVICLGFPSPFIAIHLLWVNLVTDSLPAIALGMDPKDPNNMNEKPRDKNETLFAHGGLATTIGYGALITVSVLLAYFSAFWLNGITSYMDIVNVAELSNGEAILLQARTMAFVALAVSELVHMVGMSNQNKSFIHIFKNKNWMMYLAFFVGLGLQLFVVEVPFMQQIFSTANLTIEEWLITVSMCVTPLIVHEIIVFIKFIKQRVTRN